MAAVRPAAAGRLLAAINSIISATILLNGFSVCLSVCLRLASSIPRLFRPFRLARPLARTHACMRRWSWRTEAAQRDSSAPV